MLAVFCNALESVKYLIIKGAKISLTLPDGRNALHICGQYGFADIAKVLLVANDAHRDEAEKREVEKEKAALEKAEAKEMFMSEDEEDEDWDIEMVPKKEATVTVEEEDEDDVIDLDFLDWDMKVLSTHLWYSLVTRPLASIRQIRTLIFISFLQMTALHFACFHGHPSVVKLLLDYRALNLTRPPLKSVTAKIKNSSKAVLLPLIHVALSSFEKDKIKQVLELLIQANMSLTELVDTARRNIFHYLVLNRRLDLLKLVLSLGVKSDIALAINDVDSNTQSPLHLASGAGLKEYVTLLLANSAQPDVTLEACERSF